MEGLLNILKPPGMTSHDVVAYLRRLLGQRRVGHTGTLDPGVAGVLPICVGRATRLAEYVTDAGKSYRTELVFGTATDTQDAFGRPVAEADAGDLTADRLLEVLPQFVGEVEQVPPMVSAVRTGGKRLYELARSGLTVERPARRIRIHRLSLLEFRPGPRAVARMDVDCGKGTYVRTLAVDIGMAVGLPAHLGHLVRTAAGPFRLETAITLEELAAGRPERFLLPTVKAVAHLPHLTVDLSAAAGVRHGRAPRPPEGWVPGSRDHVALLDPTGQLLAMAEYSAGPPVRLKLVKVLVGGD